MWKVILACLIVCSGLSACVKAPEYPIQPHIEFKSVSFNYGQLIPGGANGFIEPIDTIIFSFTDGDGDISSMPNEPDTSNLCGLQEGDSSILRSVVRNIFLVDNRDRCVSAFSSANIQSSGKYKGISGEILVLQPIGNKKCIGIQPNCEDDTVVFSIILKDAAGHLSNIVETEPIIIRSRP